MWIVNNDKEQAKACIRSNVQRLITNIASETSEIKNIVMYISLIISGVPSGEDAQMAGNCQRALGDLSEALQYLLLCREQVEFLDTKEWIEDEQY